MSEHDLENSLDSKKVKEVETTLKFLYDLLMDSASQPLDLFKVGLRLVFQSAISEEYFDSLLKDLNVNDRDLWGDTALHIVVDTASMLLDNGLVDHHTSGPKMHSIIIKLLSKGADINMRNNGGETPLLSAAKNNQSDAIYILLQNKANPDIKDLTGDTPLLRVVKFSDWFKDSVEVVRLLLEHGANVHARNKSGWTALDFVVSKNDGKDSALFTELLSWGGSLFVTSRDGVRLLNKLIYSREFRPPAELQVALVEYIVALQCANLDCSEYAVVESTLPFENIISPSLARRQIEEVKKTKCGSYSLYDVFDKYRDPTFVCDKIVEDAVNKASFKIVHVDYGSLLKAKFASAKERYKMMVHVMDKLTTKLPHEIVWKILTYLEDKDLESVTSAVSL